MSDDDVLRAFARHAKIYEPPEVKIRKTTAWLITGLTVLSATLYAIAGMTS